MKRWILKLLVVASCMALVLVAVDRFRDPNYTLHAELSMPRGGADVVVGNHRIAVSPSVADERGLSFRRGFGLLERFAGLYPERPGYDEPDLVWSWHGVMLYHDYGHFRCLSFPIWYLAPVLALLPGIQMVAIIWRRRKHNMPSHCSKCGYDLRAHSPGQKCPECGTMIPGKPKGEP